MRSSHPISLFSKPPQKESGPSAFVVSLVLHSFLFGVLFITIKRAEMAPRVLPDRKYEVHLLDIQRTMAKYQWYPQHSKVHARPAAAHRSLSAGGRRGLAPKVRLQRVSRNFQTPKPSPQTLIQPQVKPEQQDLPQIPVPQAIVWTAGEVVQKRIVPPKPQPPSAIHVKPKLNIPNHEITPSDVALTSTPFVTKELMPAPSTTTPVDVNGQQPGAHLPVTASKSNGPLTAARVISTSDIKLQDGTAALPVINEIAQSDSEGSPLIGQLGAQSTPGVDKSDSREDGVGVGHGNNHSGENIGGVIVDDGSSGKSGPSAVAGFSIDTGSGPPNTGDAATEHVVLRKDGQYGMVVVGASPEDDYPETANLWSGRLVYTVYLQTNTSQNWILQYSLPRVPNDPPSAAKLNAPWPYDMMRPALKYQDVILVHGFVNAVGRSEELKIVYPPAFAEAPKLLRALKQWVFRPASLNGQAAKVEVLLIIPGAQQ
jgi:hypothetical protein